jgi:hypothetical protein
MLGQKQLPEIVEVAPGWRAHLYVESTSFYIKIYSTKHWFPLTPGVRDHKHGIIDLQLHVQ